MRFVATVFGSVSETCSIYTCPLPRTCFYTITIVVHNHNELIVRNMKYLIVLACVLVGVLAADKYTDKYDNINLQEIYNNPRLFEAYFKCIMDKGKCTPEGQTLKDNLKDALETGCAKCTQKQEDGAAQTVEFLIESKPEVWQEVTKAFDPTGKYRKKYEDRAAAKGIKIPAY